MFKKILIANRGEIARRVIRTCRRLGVKTVAVYSEADAALPFVGEADEAVLIGPPPPLESYLLIDKILAAAKATGAEAIHPGYGFLSENPKFIRACAEAGLTFIGPKPDAAERMGNKVQARELVRKHGIPIVPGTPGLISDLEEAKAHAAAITYPILVKAAAGGGGIGMQLARSEDELVKAIEAAKARAAQSFGDASVYLEKFAEGPHHIEVQILGDGKGNVFHQFERECSVQRRHQKVMEESPSPFVDADLRQKITDMAIRAGKSVDYVNAGTIECLVDQHKHFYFLETNTRLQVEHPVTEMVTGLDLVEQQLRIASGEAITFDPATLRQRGHAIEARIYAENPNNFFPSPGKLTRYVEPAGEHVRVDSGYAEGNEVTIHYDPMIAKLIVWGETRAAAVERMQTALKGYVIEGIKTNIPFLLKVCGDEDFRAGRYDTHFVEHLQAKLKSAKDQALTMAYQNILYEVSEGIGTVTINRPEARNALNPETLLELRTAFLEAKLDSSVRVVLLTGSGDKAFSAGGDLGGFQQSGDDGVDRHSYFVNLFETMAHLGKPIVGAVNGHCLAGGFGVALACDLLVAGDKATFGTPEINVGLWPHMIMAVIFRNIGRKKGMELLLLGEKIDAVTAEKWNLVNRVVPHAEAKTKAREMALTLAKKSPLAMRMGRDAFYTQQDMEYFQALNFLKSQLAITLSTDDAKEGIQAFFEKRDPVWKGK